MPRPVKKRRIGCDPDYLVFKPMGIPAGELDSIEMTFDEFEALRLADVEGLYQEESAKRMHVSRQTFGNILASARRKTGLMLVEGKQLTITGGVIMMTEQRIFKCASCGHEWSVPFGVQRPALCPSCASENIHRLTPSGGFGGGRGGGGRCRGLRTGLKGRGNGMGQGQGLGRGQGQGQGLGRGEERGEHQHEHQHEHPHEHHHETGENRGGEA